MISPDMISPEWINAIANSVMAISIIISACLLLIELKKLQSDHEKGRRERAIDLLSKWDSSLTLHSSGARKFAEQLDFNQSKALNNSERFKISGNLYYWFIAALPPSSVEQRTKKSLEEHLTEKEEIEISERESSEIRWAVVTYLNNLETILSAVRHKIADKEMIKEQFIYLVSPQKGHYLLEDFRQAAGGLNTFPSIAWFAEELKKEYDNVEPGKEPVNSLKPPLIKLFVIITFLFSLVFLLIFDYNFY